MIGSHCSAGSWFSLQCSAAAVILSIVCTVFREASSERTRPAHGWAVQKASVMCCQTCWTCNRGKTFLALVVPGRVLVCPRAQTCSHDWCMFEIFCKTAKHVGRAPSHEKRSCSNGAIVPEGLFKRSQAQTISLQWVCQCPTCFARASVSWNCMLSMLRWSILTLVSGRNGHSGLDALLLIKQLPGQVFTSHVQHGAKQAALKPLDDSSYSASVGRSLMRV